MAQAGSIQTLSGPATARTPQGQVRELHVGDIVYENELIQTSNGAHITIILNNGDLIRLAQNAEVLLDASVGGPLDKYDAIVHDVEALQNALLNNEDIIEEQDTAIGETESAYYYDDPYYSGDASKGQVGSYLLGAENDTAGQTFGPLVVDDNNNDVDAPLPATGAPTVTPVNDAPVAGDDSFTV
ncbi:MAG: retention module-containing protein, partial [Deltaproteobacteria bacterium]|nr:retention module-containing protein [Deltaproteobacteria bacterium]